MVKISELNGIVSNSNKIKLQSTYQPNNAVITFSEVQVSDIVKNGNQYLVVGSATQLTTPHDPLSLPYTKKLAFLVILNSDFSVFDAREYHIADHLGNTPMEIKTNRIKKEGDDTYVIGSVTSDMNLWVPFLFKTDNNYHLECSEYLSATSDESNLIALAPYGWNTPSVIPANLSPTTSAFTQNSSAGCLSSRDGSSTTGANSVNGLKNLDVNVYSSEHKLIIESTEFLKECTIYDIMGKHQISGSGSNRFVFEIENSGAYFIQYTDLQGNSYSKKVVHNVH